MMLLQPLWLFLTIPLALSLWLWRLPSRLLLVIRCVTLLLLLLALCGLLLRLPSRAGTVVVVVDRSQSMPAGSEVSEKEAIDLIQAAMGADDRLAVVAFGQTAAIEREPKAGPFPGFIHEVGANASNLADALDKALALVPRDASGKVVVLSDGLWTGRDPVAAAARAAARGVAIDYRPLQRATANDLAIDRVDAPSSVAARESFLMTGWARAPVAQEASFELRRNGRVIASGRQALTAGLNRLTFRDQADEAGIQSYSLRLTGPGEDPVPENNHARVLVGVQGPRPILHVGPTTHSGLARLLRASGLDVREQAPEACDWSLEELSRFSVVLLENVPAEKIGKRGMETLAAWVRETGAGLMFTGGRNAYGTGGYYRSPLEPIMPVSMELREQHRKLALAIVVALDRSGSMMAPAGAGRTKMDLANAGAAQVLDLLGPMDEFAVLAVDTAAHTIADLAPVKDKGRVRDDILRIRSGGGGIYVHEALEAALATVRRGKAGTKHIILFADASDAERPGGYIELLKSCNEHGITVSAIGLGTPGDKDAELLRDVAKRGKGRVFFTADPEELPRLFAQDTFVVARTTFLDEITPIRSTAGLATLTGRQMALAQKIGGYNLCYLRDGATLATRTEDTYHAPVTAAWQAGAGRVLCYTGEADGKHAGPMAGWKGVGDYYTSLARWTSGQIGPLPDNMLITQDVRNGLHVVQLHLDPERRRESFAGLPRVSLLRGMPGKAPLVEKTLLRWTGADTLAAEYLLDGEETVVATVEVPGQRPVAMPPVCLPYAPEFRPVESDRGLVTLERLGRTTGGKERLDLAGIWQELPRLPRLLSLGPWLALAALVLLLLEVLERRTSLLSWQGRVVGRVLHAAGGGNWFPRRSAQPSAAPAVSPEPDALIPRAPTPAVAPARGKEGAGMLDALRKARERTRGRIE